MYMHGISKYKYSTTVHACAFLVYSPNFYIIVMSRVLAFQRYFYSCYFKHYWSNKSPIDIAYRNLHAVPVPLNRTDFCHKNVSSLTGVHFELPKDKFTAIVNWVCLSNLLFTSFEALVLEEISPSG